MFTGIVSDIGTITSVETRDNPRVVIACAYDSATIDLGASIACSGVCLTVVDKGPGWFAVDVSGETLSRTAPGQWREGARLNLERAMRLGDELGGHIVTGHVDGVGEVIALTADGGSTRVRIAADRALAPYIAAKGSITLQGVSLTVNGVEDQAERFIFDVSIIPHTAAVTTLSALEVGQAINIEIDILARYLLRMNEARHTAV